MTEFALVLTPLPGIGLGAEDEVGSLEEDQDEDEMAPPSEPDRGSPLQKALERATPDQRKEFRRFAELLLKRSPTLPPTIRNLSLRTMIHSVGQGLWSDEGWPPLLA